MSADETSVPNLPDLTAEQREAAIGEGTIDLDDPAGPLTAEDQEKLDAAILRAAEMNRGYLASITDSEETLWETNPSK